MGHIRSPISSAVMPTCRPDKEVNIMTVVRRDVAHSRSRPPEWNLEYYRQTFGWPVRSAGNAILLSCSGDMAVIVIPASWAGEVTHRLVLSDNLGPLVAFAEPHLSWALLAEWDDLLWPPCTAPPGVRLLHRQQTMPLPVTMGDSRGGRWVVPPNPAKRMRPRASAIYAAIKSVPLPTQVAAMRMHRRTS